MPRGGKRVETGRPDDISEMADNELIAAIIVTPKLERKLNYRLEHLKSVNDDATMGDLLELLLEGDALIANMVLISISEWAQEQEPPLSISYARKLAKDGRIKGAFFDADKNLNGAWLVPPDAVISELSTPAKDYRAMRIKRGKMKVEVI